MTRKGRERLSRCQAAGEPIERRIGSRERQSRGPCDAKGALFEVGYTYIQPRAPLELLGRVRAYGEPLERGFKSIRSESVEIQRRLSA